MAAVPIQIDGVLWDHALKSGRKVTLLGDATIQGLAPGGGPIVPPDTDPPHIDNTLPGNLPGIGGGPIIPPEPPEPEVPPGTPPDTVVKSAPAGGWGYFTDAQGAPYSAYRPREDEPGPKSG